MNEFESIEKELKGLTPKSPSSQLKDKVEIALGDAGNLAMRRLPEEVKSSSSEKKSPVFWLPWVGMGIAATLIITSLSVYFIKSGGLPQLPILTSESEPEAIILAEDPESPIHGVSVAELEQRSGMPVGGWTPNHIEVILYRKGSGNTEFFVPSSPI